MQTRNNYDKDVFNGDLGTIKAINRIDQTLTVDVDGVRVVDYDFTEADELVLAYAVFGCIRRRARNSRRW